jgi:hypothetical protein
VQIQYEATQNYAKVVGRHAATNLRTLEEALYRSEI